MPRGIYERTPLVAAKQKLTRLTTKIERGKLAIEQLERDRERLAMEIEIQEKDAA